MTFKSPLQPKLLGLRETHVANSAAHSMTCSLQHCRERPRSMVVIEVFTPVVQRILKHNMVSACFTGTWASQSNLTVTSCVMSNCCFVHKARSNVTPKITPPSVNVACNHVLLRNTELMSMQWHSGKAVIRWVFLWAAVPTRSAPAFSHLAPCLRSACHPYCYIGLKSIKKQNQNRGFFDFWTETLNILSLRQY